MKAVIVGNGVAGITAATELAQRLEVAVDVYTAEPYPYYYRPQLPRFVAGAIDQEQLFARSPEWYEERNIRVHLASKVVSLMPDERRIRLEDGSQVAYDRLLLATGARPFVPDVEGIDKQGVFTLRSLEDALDIRAYAARCERAVVIGGGLLGLETAKGLKALGLTVTALEFFPYLLPRQLDEEGAEVFRTLIEGLGIGVAVSAHTRAIVGNSTVEGIVLEDGREFPAGMVVVAAGVRADVQLAAEAGLEVERGVVVDEHMQTGAPGIYAAGDVASFHGRSWGIIPQARAQALVAAANMAGDEKVYEEIVPSTTLKIAGIDLSSTGAMALEGEEELVALRSSHPEQGVYKKLLLRGDVPVQAIVIGDKALARKLDRIISHGERLTREEAEAYIHDNSQTSSSGSGAVS